MTAAGRSFAIRRATAFDVPLIAGLHGDCFSGKEVWNETGVAEILAMPGVYGLIAAAAPPAGGHPEPAGFLLARAAADECEILSLGVRPVHRRRGAARALLRAALDQGRALGLIRVYLEVAENNAPACELYAAEGFTRAARRPGYYRHSASGATAALVLSRDLRKPLLGPPGAGRRARPGPRAD